MSVYGIVSGKYNKSIIHGQHIYSIHRGGFYDTFQGGGGLKTSVFEILQGDRPPIPHPPFSYVQLTVYMSCLRRIHIQINKMKKLN